MSELDFLAWLIIGAAYLFGVMPAVFSSCSESYGESVVIGLCVNLVVICAAVIGVAIVWAVSRVTA